MSGIMMKVRMQKNGMRAVKTHGRGAAKCLTAIDLFSGCGGLTSGLKQALFRVVGAVEVDELAAKAYRLNHRKVRIWDRDIRRLPVKEVMAALNLKPGELDLLAGCPPCQGFSSMRTLNGARRFRDERNALINDFLRFVRVLRPKCVMMENVPGLKCNWRFQKFLRQLKQLGYELKWDVLNAADYGVPQRRRRLILIAGRFGAPSFASIDASRRTVRHAIGHLPHPKRSADPLHTVPEKRSNRILQLIRQIPKNGGSRAALGRRRQLACHRACDGFKDVYGRMAWHNVAPTITNGCVNPSKGRFLHPTQNRTITLREALLLQAFPPRYRIPLDRGKFPAAELIGNALPPEFIRRHARQLRHYLLDANGARGSRAHRS
jgi:DNA (cytosine-5)-methyltransferase 1